MATGLFESPRPLHEPTDSAPDGGDGYRARLRDGYLREAAAAPETIRVIEAAAAPDEVAARIRREVVERFPDLA